LLKPVAFSGIASCDLYAKGEGAGPMIELLLLTWKSFRFALGLTAGMGLFVYFLSIRQVELGKLFQEEADARSSLEQRKSDQLSSAKDSQKAGVTADYDKKSSDLFTQYEKKRSDLFTFCLKSPDVLAPSADLNLCLNIYALFRYWPMLLLIGYMLHRWFYVEKVSVHKAAGLHTFAEEWHYVAIDVVISFALLFLAYRAIMLFNLRAAIPRQYRPYHLAAVYLLFLSGAASLRAQYGRIAGGISNWPKGLGLHRWLIQRFSALWIKLRPGKIWSRVGAAAVLGSLLTPYCACDTDRLRGYQLAAVMGEGGWSGYLFVLVYLASFVVLFVSLIPIRAGRRGVRAVCWLALSASWGMWLGFVFQEISGKSSIAAGATYRELVADPTVHHTSEFGLLDPSSIPDWCIWTIWSLGIVVPALLFLARNWRIVRRPINALPDGFKRITPRIFYALGGAVFATTVFCCWRQLSVFLWGMAMFLLGGLVELLGVRQEILSEADVGEKQPPVPPADGKLVAIPVTADQQARV